MDVKICNFKLHHGCKLHLKVSTANIQC